MLESLINKNESVLPPTAVRIWTRVYNKGIRTILQNSLVISQETFCSAPHSKMGQKRETVPALEPAPINIPKSGSTSGKRDPKPILSRFMKVLSVITIILIIAVTLSFSDKIKERFLPKIKSFTFQTPEHGSFLWNHLRPEMFEMDAHSVYLDGMDRLHIYNHEGKHLNTFKLPRGFRIASHASLRTPDRVDPFVAISALKVEKDKLIRRIFFCSKKGEDMGIGYLPNPDNPKSVFFSQIKMLKDMKIIVRQQASLGREDILQTLQEVQLQAVEENPFDPSEKQKGFLIRSHGDPIYKWHSTMDERDKPFSDIHLSSLLYSDRILMTREYGSRMHLLSTNDFENGKNHYFTLPQTCAAVEPPEWGQALQTNPKRIKGLFGVQNRLVLAWETRDAIGREMKLHKWNYREINGWGQEIGPIKLLEDANFLIGATDSQIFAVKTPPGSPPNLLIYPTSRVWP